jgi:tRNA (cmo5U34)-methyltransferase
MDTIPTVREVKSARKGRGRKEEVATLRQIEQTFDDASTSYDQIFPRVILRYREIHEVMLYFLTSLGRDFIDIVELGVGTGELTAEVLRRFPEAGVEAIDLSAKMLEVAGQKLLPYKDRVNLIHSDFGTYEFMREYDLAISSMALHHLPDKDKLKLMKSIHRSLKEEGVFLFGDLIQSPSSYLDKKFFRIWKNYLRFNGLSRDEIETRVKGHLNNDLPATLPEILHWMKEAGFRDVDCLWKYFNHAVVVGIK